MPQLKFTATPNARQATKEDLVDVIVALRYDAKPDVLRSLSVVDLRNIMRVRLQALFNTLELD